MSDQRMSRDRGDMSPGQSRGSNMRKIAVGDLGEFWYGDYKEPFTQLEGALPGHPQGAVLKDDDGKVLCAYCGKTWDYLAKHVEMSHGMSSREYKAEVGLLQKTALVSERVRVSRSRTALRNLAEGKKPPTPRNTTTPRKGAEHPQWTPEKLNMTGRCYQQVLAVARDVTRDGRRLTRAALERRGIGEATWSAYFPTFEALAAKVGGSAYKARRYTKSEMLSVLRALGSTLGRTPTISDLGRYGAPTGPTYRKHFGSYAAACRAAGLDPNLPVAKDEEYAIKVLVGYATTGNVQRVARLTHTTTESVAQVFATFGCPHPNTPAAVTQRKAWAAEMARRLAGWPEQGAA